MRAHGRKARSQARQQCNHDWVPHVHLDKGHLYVDVADRRRMQVRRAVRIKVDGRRARDARLDIVHVQDIEVRDARCAPHACIHIKVLDVDRRDALECQWRWRRESALDVLRLGAQTHVLHADDERRIAVGAHSLDVVVDHVDGAGDRDEERDAREAREWRARRARRRRRRLRPDARKDAAEHGGMLGKHGAADVPERE